jgi:hypothetical protein
MIGRNLLFLARYRTPSFSGPSVTGVRPFTLSEPCFPEIRRKAIPQGVHRHDSGRSLWELGPGNVRDIAMLVSVEGAVLPGLRRYRSGAHKMVPLRPALIILGNALLRIKVGVGEMDKSNTAGDGALGLFLDEGRRPWGAPQLLCKHSLLPQWFRCGRPSSFSGMLWHVIKWAWTNVQVKHSRRWCDEAVSRRGASALRCPPARVQNFAPPKTVSLLESLAFSSMLFYVFKLAWTNVQVKYSRRWHAVAVSG